MDCLLLTGFTLTSNRFGEIRFNRLASTENVTRYEASLDHVTYNATEIICHNFHLLHIRIAPNRKTTYLTVDYTRQRAVLAFNLRDEMACTFGHDHAVTVYRYQHGLFYRAFPVTLKIRGSKWYEFLLIAYDTDYLKQLTRWYNLPALYNGIANNKPVYLAIPLFYNGRSGTAIHDLVNDSEWGKQFDHHEATALLMDEFCSMLDYHSRYPVPLTVSDDDMLKVQHARQYIAYHLNHKPLLAWVTGRLLPTPALRALFARLHGISVRDFLILERMRALEPYARFVCGSIDKKLYRVGYGKMNDFLTDYVRYLTLEEPYSMEASEDFMAGKSWKDMPADWPDRCRQITITRLSSGRRPLFFRFYKRNA